MSETVIRYEGYEGPARTESRTAANGGLSGKISTFIDDYPWSLLLPAAVFGIGITLGLRWLAKKTLGGDVGEDEDDFLTSGFSAELGIRDGAFSGMPLKYKWLPARHGRRGHPASLDLEFTVNNPRGARMRVHKEGAFNRPLGSLPPEIQTPPAIESHGFVLRLDPPDILNRETAGVLDKAVPPLCAAGLYEAVLEGNKLSVSVIRTATYEIEETKVLVEAAAQAARLFN